ncbi:hypothetical protein NORO109296_25410 [Nocardiopsis rhodophaea]
MAVAQQRSGARVGLSVVVAAQLLDQPGLAGSGFSGDQDGGALLCGGAGQDPQFPVPADEWGTAHAWNV